MDNRPAVYPYLLAMDNEPKTSDGANDRSPLCEACHVGHNKNNRKARSASDHPVDQIIGGKEVIDNWQHTRAYESMYYIGSGGNALADWKPNDGAVRWPYAPADTGSPVPGIDHGTKANAAIVCTSCHSAHGGRPGTSLLREVFGCATGAKMPQEDINRSIITDDWCFSCHSVGAE